MATLTPLQLDDKGQTYTDLVAQLVAAVDLSNDFYNDGNCVIVVSNASAGVRVLTVKSQPDPFGRGGVAADDIVTNIPAGKVGFTSFLNPASFNSGGKATFTLDATATTTIGVLRLRKLR